MSRAKPTHFLGGIEAPSIFRPTKRHAPNSESDPLGCLLILIALAVLLLVMIDVLDLSIE